MSEHPISQLVDTVMNNLKGMIDVNTIVGEAVETPDGTVLIPISRVAFGFGAGGGETDGKKTAKVETSESLLGGGTGAGVSINPVAFLIVSKDGIRLLPINGSGKAVDKLVDYIPYAVERINDYIKSKKKENFE